MKPVPMPVVTLACKGYVTGYVEHWFHNSTFPGQEALALGPWAAYYNALVPMLEGGLVAKGAV